MRKPCAFINTLICNAVPYVLSRSLCLPAAFLSVALSVPVLLLHFQATAIFSVRGAFVPAGIRFCPTRPSSAGASIYCRTEIRSRLTDRLSFSPVLLHLARLPLYAGPCIPAVYISLLFSGLELYAFQISSYTPFL